jgi:hypothetical protein
MTRDPPAQLGQAERRRVSDRPTLDCEPRGLAHGARRRRAGLTELHMHDRSAVGLDGMGLRQYLHGDERSDCCPQRRHRRLCRGNVSLCSRRGSRTGLIGAHIALALPHFRLPVDLLRTTR